MLKYWSKQDVTSWLKHVWHLFLICGLKMFVREEISRVTRYLLLITSAMHRHGNVALECTFLDPFSPAITLLLEWRRYRCWHREQTKVRTEIEKTNGKWKVESPQHHQLPQQNERCNEIDASGAALKYHAALADIWCTAAVAVYISDATTTTTQCTLLLWPLPQPPQP